MLSKKYFWGGGRNFSDCSIFDFFDSIDPERAFSGAAHSRYEDKGALL
jgi:hypothetical protein